MKPVARRGGINGVALVHHIEAMRPEYVAATYTEGLYSLEQIIQYLEAQPYAVSEHGSSIRVLRELAGEDLGKLEKSRVAVQPKGQ